MDLKESSRKSLPSQIALVPQENSLFNRSVSENIGMQLWCRVACNIHCFYLSAYGKPNATQEEIEDAAKKACAHDFIMELSEG